MDQSQKNEILRLINELEDLDISPLAHSSTESRSQSLLSKVLFPLLGAEGYETQDTGGASDYGVDFFATRSPDPEFGSEKLGITHKHFFYGQPDAELVERARLAAAYGRYNRMLLIANRPLTEVAKDIARREGPTTFEVLDLNGLRAWVGRLDVEKDIDKLEIKQIFKAINTRFAKMIADNPRNLEELEWRDVERLVADLFDGLGFRVTLTPGSKDGGKDVILECTVEGKRRNYIVEIKHWRSKQRVGESAVVDFLNVLVREKRDGGLYLSTYGYSNNAFESLTEIERKNLKFGDEAKLVALCKTFTKFQSGILSPPIDPTELIFADTV